MQDNKPSIFRKENIPNLVTSFRFLSVILLFFEPPTLAFFIVYGIIGLSDAFDGLLARKLNATSELGSKLDSVADLLFYTIMLIRMMPILWETLPRIIWCLVALVLLLRLGCYIYVSIRFHSLASLHTIFNKITGVMVFAVPFVYLLPTRFFVAYCFVLAGIAFLAVGYEMAIHFIRSKNEKKAAH